MALQYPVDDGKGVVHREAFGGRGLVEAVENCQLVSYLSIKMANESGHFIVIIVHNLYYFFRYISVRIGAQINH